MADTAFGPCRVCGLPVLTGQPRYTVPEFLDPPQFCHYDCHEASRARVRTDAQRMRDLAEEMTGTVAALRRRLGL